MSAPACLLAATAAAIVAAGAALAEADASAVRTAVEEHIGGHGTAMLGEFREFLGLPNVSKVRSDMDANAAWIQSYIGERGFTSTVVSAGRAPYILAEKNIPGAERTLLIYAHFDGQPVEPANWATPPFEPTLKKDGTTLPWSVLDGGELDSEWRVYARSAGDDKAPIIALMHAMDALDAAGIVPTVNIKLFLDGEEEFGSPTVADVLAEHADKLDADLMLFCDGPMHQSGRRQLVFGVRGDIGVHLTAYGAARPLHSGHYGNWAPHPTDALMRLLATLKDMDGNILVPGYLDEVQPITEAETAAIEAMPRVDEQLRDELALGRVEGSGRRLEELIMQPAINIVGFQAGGVDTQARNIILSTAQASLDLRLVKGQTIPTVKRTLEAHFREQGFYVVDREPTIEERRSNPGVLKVSWDGGYPAYRSDLDGPEARRLAAILEDYEGEAPLLTPTMGGSLPIHLFDQALDMPIVMLPIANHDNNQHGRDENLRIGNLTAAVGVYAALLAGY
ncbi:MAG: M20/M25/M40 family metallo-hydrolase [Halieaceae bacterium]|nr:M20/M25/M40 family metallo-hydrolase [Halieaceae bacterium]